MIRVAAHHILSPLGASTAANFDAVRRGETAVRRWEGLWQLPQPFMASCFDDAAVDWLQPGYTRFESMAIASIRGAIAQWQQHVGEEKASVGSPRTVLILSTTKGNIALMWQEQGNNSRLDEMQAAFLSAKLPLLTGKDYSKYSAMYNDADQAIGDNVSFILAVLDA